MQLVVVEQDLTARRSSDGAFAALARHALHLALGGGGEQPVPPAEAADDGLHRHARAAGDLVERDLLAGRLPEHLDGRVEDPLGGRRRGLGARDHPVRTRRRWRFHVNDTNAK